MRLSTGSTGARNLRETRPPPAATRRRSASPRESLFIDPRRHRRRRFHERRPRPFRRLATNYVSLHDAGSGTPSRFGVTGVPARYNANVKTAAPASPGASSEKHPPRLTAPASDQVPGATRSCSWAAGVVRACAVALAAGAAATLVGCGSHRTSDASVLVRGRTVFARSCASCHTLTGHDTGAVGVTLRSPLSACPSSSASPASCRSGHGHQTLTSKRSLDTSTQSGPAERSGSRDT